MLYLFFFKYLICRVHDALKSWWYVNTLRQGQQRKYDKRPKNEKFNFFSNQIS